MSFKRSYYPHYFSIEDILATQERVPCKFLVQVHRLGYLNPSSESEDIAEGTDCELPFWLARSLCTSRRPILNIDMPKIYKEAYREILKADPCVVDLHKLSLYFFEFGLYLAGIDHRESPAVSEILVKTFKERFRQVMDWAQNCGTDPTIIHRMDMLERELFNEGRHAKSSLDTWLNTGSNKITAANMVINHKKRKLAALQLD